MIIVDVNLLLYAVITGFPKHAEARKWWQDAVNHAEVGLSSPALFGFLRIATNPRVFTTPLGIEAAVGHVHDWLDRPNVNFVQPGRRHLEIALSMLTEVGTAGNLTTDVQLAAIAIEHDAQLASNDTDFARFRDLRWLNPLT